jgi:hypothetical protein
VKSVVFFFLAMSTVAAQNAGQNRVRAHELGWFSAAARASHAQPAILRECRRQNRERDLAPSRVSRERMTLEVNSVITNSTSTRTGAGARKLPCS